jgi:uncharacterized membrane protein
MALVFGALLFAVAVSMFLAGSTVGVLHSERLHLAWQ